MRCQHERAHTFLKLYQNCQRQQGLNHWLVQLQQRAKETRPLPASFRAILSKDASTTRTTPAKLHVMHRLECSYLEFPGFKSIPT